MIAKNKPKPNAIPAFQESEKRNLSYYAQFLQNDPSASHTNLTVQEKIRPDPEWQANLLASFRKHKDEFFLLRQSQAPPETQPVLKFGESQTYLHTSPGSEPLAGGTMAPPTPSRLASLTPPQVIHLLGHFTSVFQAPYSIDEVQVFPT